MNLDYSSKLLNMTSWDTALKHEALVHVNVDLLIRKFPNFEDDRDDLLQEGFIALEAAARGFDSKRGIKFETYGSESIRRALYRYINSRFQDAYTMQQMYGDIKGVWLPEGFRPQEFPPERQRRCANCGDFGNKENPIRKFRDGNKYCIVCGNELFDSK